MWMANAVIDKRYRDMAYYATVIFSYLCGLAAFRKADLSLKKKSLPICALAVAALFCGSDCVHCLLTDGARWVPMSMLALGFGIINSVGAEVAGTLTFVITGSMTRLVNQFVDRVSRTAGRKKLTEADKLAAIQQSSVVMGFFGGALLGCFLNSLNLLHKFGNFSMLGFLYAALFLWQDMEFLGGAWWLREDGKMCDLDDDGRLCEEAS